jgi:probable phosphoglycerate mutase
MIYLIRHGQTDWNLERRIQGHTDIPLNDKGKSDAEKAAEEISQLKIDKIISSDLQRAKETAKIIAECFKRCPIIFDNRLREISFGDLEGVCVSDISSDVWEIFNHSPEKLNVETAKTVYNRI